MLEVVEEPLEASAGIARRLAVRHCAPACRAYHGLWQFLRLMALGKTMSGLSAAFLDEIRSEASRWPVDLPYRRARVLVSGCADYSAYAHVHAACSASGQLPTVTAVDLCETPLRLTNWLARRLGREVFTIRSEILDHSVTEPYDLIVTSSFLGYFPGAVRARLFATYARLLRPGGLLLISNRLRDGDENVLVGFSTPAAQAFTLEVIDRASRLEGVLRAEAQLAAGWARDYAARFQSYPVNNRAGVEGILRAAGFDCTSREFTASSGERSVLSGPSVADGAAYLLLKARRRLAVEA